MKAPVVLSVIVTAFSLICGGCVTGPKYTYTKQKDSASVKGSITLIQRTDHGPCYVEIAEIDGRIANFVASRPGAHWLPGGGNPLYVAPGRHAITLYIGQPDEVIGLTGRDASMPSSNVSLSQPTLKIDFSAGHAYRFAANLTGAVIAVTLWDETKGHSPGGEVAHWEFKSEGSDSENTQPGQNR